jgi:NAD(P)-dependent dehydrogenase (short-subunit alcohol dehydrogenase family)
VDIASHPADVELDGRRILVTGASAGIGRALVRAYSQAGARVWAVARRGRHLTETVAGLAPDRTHTVSGDVTEPAVRQAVHDDIEFRSSGLDVVVHAAGVLGPPNTLLEDYPEDAWRRVFEVNATAVHLMHQSLGRLLRNGLYPTVIGVSSGVARRGRAGWGMYAVSKSALEAWLEVLADEWQDAGRVYAVNPGATATGMRAAAAPDEDPRSLPATNDILPVFLHLARPDCRIPSGERLQARDWIGKDPWSGPR